VIFQRFFMPGFYLAVGVDARGYLVAIGAAAAMA
jgi:hypothetical protein